MTEIPPKDKIDVYNMVLNGQSIDNIATTTSIGHVTIAKIIKEISSIENYNNRPTKLGRKDEPYYECEEDYALTPVYEWNDLNLNEIEFYEDYSKGRSQSIR